jgi:hypothetical protein
VMATRPSPMCFSPAPPYFPSILSLAPWLFLGLVPDPDTTLLGLEEDVLDVVCLAHLDASNLGDSIPLIDGLEQAGEQGICNANLGRCRVSR